MYKNRIEAFKMLPLAVCVSAASQSLLAQEDSEPQRAGLMMEEVFVTGVAKGTAKIDTSVSVSSISYDDTFQTAPRSLGEIYRSIPGLRSEPATGEGNGSISVRGIPLATGGYKYIQLQEDGLPVLQFGDIVAGNVPNFVRGDFTLERIESIRGGSASTLTSYAPGGIINHISKTGEEQGGAIGITAGLDYDEQRVDFAYGSPIADDLYFHVGGFYRKGEGFRDIGYDANDGTHIKASLTKEFDNGYIRLNYKNLDDNIATYTRSPSRADGASGGEFDDIPGFDGRNEDPSSVHRQNATKYDRQGNRINRRVKDHIEANVQAWGFEAAFDFEDGWSVINRFRDSEIDGGFIAPLALNFGDAVALAQDGFWACGCDNPEITYANGPNAGEAYDGLALGILELDFTNDALDFTVNDLRISKEWDFITVTGGIYYSEQTINQQWNNWDYYIIEAKGDNAAGLNIVNGDTGQQHSLPGGVSGTAFLANFVDFEYETIAPYLDINWLVSDTLTLNASIRQDNVDVTGEGIKSGDFFGGGGVIAIDRNGDGDTDDPLDKTAVATPELNALATTANYDRDYESWSIGGNWAFADNMAVFARYSQGSVVVADRIWDGSNPDNNRLAAANSGLLEGVDDVDQAEAGFKYAGADLDVFATLFYAETEETQSEITTQRAFSQTYEAYGIELEASYSIGDFLISGNFTYTDAEIDEAEDASLEGNQPNRQANYIYTITPQYIHPRFSIGASLVGSDDFYHGDTEAVQQDAYLLVHAFATYYVTDNITIGINGNNLTDEYVVSFSESGVFPLDDGRYYNLSEGLNGRTIAASIRYDF